MRDPQPADDVATVDPPHPYEEEMKPPVVLRRLTRAHLRRPSAARVYDCYLGGDHNFCVDRVFVRQQRAILPIIEDVARYNRGFLVRAVRFAAERGITQFVDLGSGAPTQQPVHEVAESIHPGVARVAYVDNEPIAIGHSERILKKTGDPERHVIMPGDLRDPDDLRRRLFDLELMDWNQPICLLLVAVLHFISPQHQPHTWMRRFRQILPPGSVLAMSHMTVDGAPEERIDQAERFRRNYSSTTNPVYYRTREQFKEFFGDMPLVEPGICWTTEWRYDEDWPRHIDRAEAMVLCGVAEKPDAKTF